MSEALFEVWADGRPLLDGGGLVRRLLEGEARLLVEQIEAEGRRAVLVPDQSKLPPDHEMLQDR